MDVTDDQGTEIPTRRRFLKYTGTAAVAGAAGLAAWDLFPYADRFDTVVDVAERGDAGGEEPINDLLESNLADDTLFFFRDGTYIITDQFIVQDHDNVGLVGPDATLKPSAGQSGDWLVAHDVSRVLLDGLTLSSAAAQTGVRSKVHVRGGENVVRNVSVTGFHDVPDRTHGFTLQVNGSDSVLRLENVDLTAGARNGTGIFVHPARNPGTLRLEDCRIANWYEQGLYGSSHGGPMYVIGGRYANNGRAQVRVGGGGADTEAIVRDVMIRVTDPHPADAKEEIRGIWLHEGEGTLVENCDVAVTDLSDAGSSGAIVLGAEQGATKIRNTAIRVDDSTFAVTATSPKTEGFVIPSMERPPESWELSVETVTITGSADRDVDVWVVDRPGCHLRNLTIDQGGTNRDGIGLLRSPGAEISGLSCSTSGFPILTSVPGEDRGCLVSLKEIEKLESTAEDTDGASAAPAASVPETHTSSTADTETKDSREQADEVTTVSSTDGQYCLEPSDFDLTKAQPVLGVVELDSGELFVRPVSESTLIPY